MEPTGASLAWPRAPRPGSLPDAVLVPSLFAVVGLVTALDWFTGPAASPELFYAVLILGVVWVSGPRAGILSSAMAAVSELVVSRYGPEHVGLATQAWNSVTHLAFYITICVIVIAQRRLFAERERLATTDPLTGALNRRAFMEILETEMDRAHRYRRAGSLLFLDLDGLKTVNDDEGHHAGDAMIVSFVEAVNLVIRSTDRLARLGGDEFAVFCPETSPSQAVRVGERICAALDRVGPESAGPARVSIGVAGIDATVTRAATLLSLADDAMYQAKRSGGHGVRVAPGANDRDASPVLRLAVDADLTQSANVTALRPRLRVVRH